MKKIYLSWNDVESLTQDVIQKMTLSTWRPDYVVGLTRGGLVPANLISQYFDVPMHCLRVSLRDGGEAGSESNLWMAEDAASGSNILIVDDINDTGATLDWIRKDWQVDSKWGQNVRVAVLYDNDSSLSEHTPDYSAQDINKATDAQWIVFPWEEWWKR